MTRPELPYGPDNNPNNNPAFHGYDQYPATGANAPQPSVLSHSVNAMKFHGKRLIDDTFGDGRTAHPINAPERNGWIHMKGTGKLNIGEALTWGVNTTFSRWKFWIPCGLGLLLALLVGLIPFVGGLVISALYALWLSLGLKQTLVYKNETPEEGTSTFWVTLGMYVLNGIMLLGALLLCVTVTELLRMATGYPAPSLSAGYPAMQTELTPFDWLALIVFLAILPFFCLQVWYAADNGADFGGCIVRGFQAAKRNYLPLLGLIVVSFLIVVLGAAVVGVGLIVAVPVFFLTWAHAYRQISGGPVPSKSTLSVR
ncbi:hypothetical protein ACUY2P_07770 [Corynebacterium hadale]